MPRFYFNVRDSASTTRDPEGSNLPTLDEARQEAILNARDAMSRAILTGRDLSHTTTIEICDRKGAVLMRVPFTDAILPDV